MPGKRARPGAGARSGCRGPPAARCDAGRGPRRRLFASAPSVAIEVSDIPGSYSMDRRAILRPAAAARLRASRRQRARSGKHHRRLRNRTRGRRRRSGTGRAPVGRRHTGRRCTTPTLDRTTDATGPVSAKSADELARVDAGCRFTDEHGRRAVRRARHRRADAGRRAAPLSRRAHHHRAEGGHRGLRRPRGRGRLRGGCGGPRVPGRVRVAQRSRRAAAAAVGGAPAPASPRCAGRCTDRGWGGRCDRCPITATRCPNGRGGCGWSRRASSGTPTRPAWRWRCGRWTTRPTWSGCCAGAWTA